MMLADLDADNFDQVIQSDKIVLIDFWAEWCGYCKLMEPIVQEVAAKYQGKILVYRLKDETVEIASRFGFRGLPAFVIFSEGKPMCSLLGATTRMRFESWIEDCLERNPSSS